MRSLSFDPEEVLRSVATLWIEKGYDKTSMQDLKSATGLHPGSIYNAFDNKRGLFKAALELYLQDRLNLIDRLFEQNETLMQGFTAYMDSVLEDYENVQERDCLFQKSLTEFSHQDEEIARLVNGMLSLMENKFTGVFQVMMDNREISPGRDPRQLAQFIMMGLYGMRNMSYTHPEAGVLRNLCDSLLQHVRG